MLKIVRIDCHGVPDIHAACVPSPGESLTDVALRESVVYQLTRMIKCALTGSMIQVVFELRIAVKLMDKGGCKEAHLQLLESVQT